MAMTIIGADTGNSLMKSANFIFPVGLSAWNEEQPTADKLYYNGKYYTHTGNRTVTKEDKTVDDTYFILTLLAIGKELQQRYRGKGGGYEIGLAVGIPPGHFKNVGLRAKFANYFTRGEIQMSYNDIPYRLRIARVEVFAQGFAAIFPLPGETAQSPNAHLKLWEIAKHQEVYLLDWGGYTLDLLLLRRGVWDLDVCYSYDKGANQLYKLARDQYKAAFDYAISMTEFESVLKNQKSLLPFDGQQMILEIAAAYVKDCFLMLREDGHYLQYKPTYVMGGGGRLLASQIQQGGYLVHGQYIKNIRANAQGYEAMFRQKVLSSNG